MKFVFACLVLVAGVLGCRSKKSTSEPKVSSTDQRYLPVADFIREDIRKTDSFAGGILRKVRRETSFDSAFITPPEFHREAEVFFSPELDSNSFQQNFKESSFMDETSQLLQFVYEPKNAGNNQLRKIIVYIKPSLSTDQVTRVYLEKEYASGDTTVQLKMTWTMKQYFTNAIIRQVHDKTTTEIRKVIWDPTLFSEE